MTIKQEMTDAGQGWACSSKPVQMTLLDVAFLRRLARRMGVTGFPLNEARLIDIADKHAPEVKL